jgi:hypothetical protein
MTYEEIIEAAAAVFVRVIPDVSAADKLGDLALLAAVTIATWSKPESAEENLNVFIGEVRRECAREAALRGQPVLVRLAER